jgi:hypothetical protein
MPVRWAVPNSQSNVPPTERARVVGGDAPGLTHDLGLRRCAPLTLVILGLQIDLVLSLLFAV